MRRALLCAMVATAGLGLSACAEVAPSRVDAGPPQNAAERLVLSPSSFADLPGWTQDQPAEALPALRRSCARMMRAPPNRPVGPEPVFGVARDWAAACGALSAAVDLNAAGARAYFEAWFRPYRVSNGDAAEGLFTGYYEPELRGSRRRHGRYVVPLYRAPPDLVQVELGDFRDALKGQRVAGRVQNGRLIPYPDRAQIEAGALNGRGLELVWVDDAVDAFFLHVQGSGRILLDGGGAMRVGYAGQNGHPYFAIGRELIARGALTPASVSLQSIREWLRRNPGEAAALMNKNPSYVFFRELNDGPIGAEGVPLTPGRSLAIDRKLLPYGSPLWLDVADPLDPTVRLRRLVVAQDTGGAITGPVRGDLFWGSGPEAEARAGVMKSRGSYWLLLPKGIGVGS